MSISKAEQADLNELQKRLRAIVDGCINVCSMLDRMTADEFKNSGYRHKDEALAAEVRRAITKRNQAIAAHIKKWPDK